jgi:hypothetical protein
MAHVVARAEVIGSTVVWLGVWEANPCAVAFYRKWGFEVVGEQIFPVGKDAQRDLVMRRELVSRPLPEDTTMELANTRVRLNVHDADLAESGFACEPRRYDDQRRLRADSPAQNLVQNPRVAFVIGWEHECTVQYEGLADVPKETELAAMRATMRRLATRGCSPT